MKKLLLLSFSFLLILFISGCGTSTSGNTDSGSSDFPKKPITIIVPFSAGGGTDATARSLASATEKFLGQSIGVVNKTGGGGAIGMTAGAEAKPDGYTVTFATIELATLHHLKLAELTYKDFKPIAQINNDPAAVTVAADSPYNTLKEFLDAAKNKEFNVGTLGTGDIWDFAAISIEQETGVKFRHVPFDGAAPAVTALLGGHIDAVTVSPAEVLPQVQAGKLKVLAVLDDKRSAVLPDVPTFEEEGIKVENLVGCWRGILVPKDTPDEVVSVLTDAFMKGADTDEFKKYMNNNGLAIVIRNADDFTKVMEESDKYFGDLVEKLGLAK